MKRETLVRLMERFGSDREIAEHLGWQNKRNVKYWRQKHGLQAGMKREKALESKPIMPGMKRTTSLDRIPVNQGDYKAGKLMKEAEINELFAGKDFK